MRMYAVHSEYEVVVSEEIAARSAAAAKWGLVVLPPEILKKTCLCGIWSYFSGSTAVSINWGWEKILTKDHEQASFYYIK